MPNSKPEITQTTVSHPKLADTALPHHPVIGKAGEWDLLVRLGEGALCRVYLARPSGNNAAHSPHYIAKVLLRKWHYTFEAIEILRREARVGSAVSHANVVPVFSSATEAAPFHLIMPLLEGATLSERLATGWRPSLPVAMWIARQTVLGLAAILNQSAMIHGDVKPSNLMIAPNGHTTLLDLGFARTAEENRASTDRPIMGTLPYSAPETLTSALAASPQSDMYSLGITLYELLTGAPPFTSDDPAKLIDMQRNEKPVCVRDRRPTLPKPFASLVHTLLAKDPLRRPESWKEVLDRMVRLEIEWFADRAA